MTKEEAIKELRKTAKIKFNDDEDYHIVFDKLLEERLKELDPEWIKALLKEYQESGMDRWYA